jgi:Zn-dependent protease
MAERSYEMLQTPGREEKNAISFSRAEEICPEAVPDLGIWTLYKRGSSGAPVYILGSPEVDRFVLIPTAAITVIQAVIPLMDGNHSIESIAHIIQQRYARKIDIARLYDRLSINGLILRPAPKSIERGDIESMSLTLLKLDIRSVFRRIRKVARALAPFLAVLSILLILAGVFVQCFDSTYAREAVKLTSRNGKIRADIVLYYTFLFCSFFFHELSHGLAATYFGLIPRKLCFGLYLGYLPMVYLRIGGTYTLPEWQRIVVWFAGVWWNFTFGSICALLLRIHSFPPGTAHVIFVAIVANYWLGIVNLYPFMPTDGYFITATLAKGVNFRSNAWREIGRWLKGEPSKFSTTMILFLTITISTSIWVFYKCVHSIRSFSDIRLWLTAIPILFIVVRSTWQMFHTRQSSPTPREA